MLCRGESVPRPPGSRRVLTYPTAQAARRSICWDPSHRLFPGCWRGPHQMCRKTPGSRARNFLKIDFPMKARGGTQTQECTMAIRPCALRRRLNGQAVCGSSRLACYVTSQLLSSDNSRSWPLQMRTVVFIARPDERPDERLIARLLEKVCLSKTDAGRRLPISQM